MIQSQDLLHVIGMLVLAFSLLPFVAGQMPQCVMRKSSTCACDLSSDLGYIDLFPLADTSGQPAFFMNPPGRYNYWYNPCQSFTQLKTCSGDIAVCQSSGTGSNCGKQSSASITVTQTSPTFQATISYTGGDGGRNSLIQLLCDPSMVKPTMQFTGENPREHYNFKLTSKYCCPQANPTSHPTPQPGPSPTEHRPTPRRRHNPEHHGIGIGTILDITFLMVVVTYLVGGILIMHFRRGATGKELIPNLTFWTSLPGLIKDGAIFLSSKIRNALPRK